MTTVDLNYYRERADEELAAADRAVDSAIAQIHRDMAQRYRDMLNGEADRMYGDARVAQPMGGAIAEQGTAFG